MLPVHLFSDYDYILYSFPVEYQKITTLHWFLLFSEHFYLFLWKLQTASMKGRFVWGAEVLLEREEWKYAWVVFGVQSVMMDGALAMLMWSADNWDFQQ